MSENSGGLGPPKDPFNMYNVIHRGEMPTLEASTRKNFKALKSAYFTHPSDAERYFVIGGDAIRNMNVFEIEEGLQMISKNEFMNVTVLNSGDVMVKTRDIQQVEALKSTNKFGGNNAIVSISENGALNQSHAIIRVKEIMKLETDLIAENLKKYNVVQVQRLKRKMGNTWVDTPTHVLTFNTPIIPAEIKVGFLHVKTEIYIPSPFRCASCQKLGHTKKRCDSKRNRPTCSFCSQEYHLYGPCLPPRCVNCKGNHPSSSKTCPRYLEEREINAIRVTLRIPYKLARQELNIRRGKPPNSTSNTDTRHPKLSSAPQTKSFADAVKIDDPKKIQDVKITVNTQKSQNVNPTMENDVPYSPKITPKAFKRNFQKAQLEEFVTHCAVENPLDSQKMTKTVHDDKHNSQVRPIQLETSTLQHKLSGFAGFSPNPILPMPHSHLSLPSSPFIPLPHPPQHDAEPPDIEIVSD